MLSARRRIDDDVGDDVDDDVDVDEVGEMTCRL